LSDLIHNFQVTGSAVQRLDKFLVECLPEFSRSRLQALIQDGRVTVDGKTAGKAGLMVEVGQQVQVVVPPPEPTDLIPEEIALDVIYEDDQLLVINKPAGMVVHPAPGHSSGTLVHAVLAHDPDMEGIGGEQRPGVVHRLDKDTSGVLLLAKNDAMHRWLQAQFKARKLTKEYLALVDGQPPTPTGRIEAAIGRDPSHRKRMAIVPDHKGRDAVTEYSTVETFPQHTLLRVRILTGRTHQIRLHLAFLGCPVAGDLIYGHRHSSIPLKRFFLHAARLTINLPGKPDPVTFEAPLPSELEEVLKQLCDKPVVQE
jgi:23S rRNA pseudouridine1911/1915/1917 synthase